MVSVLLMVPEFGNKGGGDDLFGIHNAYNSRYLSDVTDYFKCENLWSFTVEVT